VPGAHVGEEKHRAGALRLHLQTLGRAAAQPAGDPGQGWAGPPLGRRAQPLGAPLCPGDPRSAMCPSDPRHGVLDLQGSPFQTLWPLRHIRGVRAPPIPVVP
jgi:hypothetical protein